MEKIKELFEQDVIITGVDQGNKSAKFSYLNEEGNIESFSIPTIVAPAEEKRSSIEGNTSSTSIEKRLHLKIQSKSVSTANQERYVHVGYYARNKEGKEEPGYELNKNKAKFSNDLHIITTLAGLAIIAAKTGKDKIYVPYAGGLPVNEMKELGSEQAFESVKGTHHVTFIDGPVAGKEVTIVIEKGKMYGEGAITDLSLNFDIVNGEVVETSLSDRLTNNYVLGDLGAGTTDVIVFTEDGIDGSLSQSLDIGGTNPFIDRMMEKVNDLPEYQEMKEMLGIGDGEDVLAYRSREDFMSEVVEPAIISYIRNNLDRPTFEVKLLKRKTVDVTDIVMEEIEKYAEAHKAELNKVWNDTRADDVVLVGGGLLFGYPVFKELQDEFREKLGKDWAVFPDNVEESPFFTSRGYLIANYMNTVHQEFAEKVTEEEGEEKEVMETMNE